MILKVQAFLAAAALWSVQQTVEASNVRGYHHMSSVPNDLHHDNVNNNSSSKVHVLQENHSHGKHEPLSPRLLSADEDFTPLSCNPVDPNDWNCTPWPFGQGSADDIKVPCGTCYTMGAYTAGEKIDIEGTLNIEGKLDFQDGTKLSLVAKGIFVQGELTMKSTKIIDGEPDITIQLVGDDDVTFTPNEENEGSCPLGGCHLGSKPFLVAGGKVDIDGLPDACPTWTHIKKIKSGETPKPIMFPKKPVLPFPSEGSCGEVLLSENFESGKNKWYGNIGAEESIQPHGNNGDDHYLHIERRTHEYQGPMIDLPITLKECLLSETAYFFTAKIRISPGLDYDGDFSNCHSSQVNCPKLQFSHMDSLGSVRWKELISTDGAVSIVDGEWFTLHQSITIDDLMSPHPSDVFSLFSINGVEPGVDISIDDISISLPPVGAYPDPDNACSELVINGNAEEFGQFTYPFKSYMNSNLLTIKEENGNNFFSIRNRKQDYDSLAIDLTKGCLQEGTVYSFSADIRLDSEEAVVPRLRLVSKGVPGQENLVFDNVQSCPQISKNTGWTTCTADFTATSHLTSASWVQLLILFPLNAENDADFDNISVTFKAASQEGIDLLDADNLDQCYTTGTEFMIPSDDLAFDSAQVSTLSAVQPLGKVQIHGDLTRVSTFIEDPDCFSEFAMLSRNIKLMGDENNDIGPTFIILSTPLVAQKVKGVEFIGFGQEGILGRNPINFKMSGDATGSVLSKNTIRNSKNRCINIHSTNNVSIKENIALDTLGHCFALQSGHETGNAFHKNLGAVTKVATAPLGENDYESSTFYITNPSNSFTGNSAAGSQQNGFWFDLDESKAGLNFGAFEDNTSHSNSAIGIKTYPVGLKPNSVAVWTNTKSYRNGIHGIIFHVSRNVKLDGGIISDNRIGIDVWQADNISISNMAIKGYSSAFKAIAESVVGTEKRCSVGAESPPLNGVRLHPNAMVNDSGGTTITNTTFSGFVESTGCNPSSSAIVFNSINIADPSYTTTTQISGVTFELSGTPQDEITLCAAHSVNMLDIYITDLDGSLNPNGVGEEGLIVSNTAAMTSSGSCSSLPGSCAQYCTGVDMAQLLLGTAIPTQSLAPTTSPMPSGALLPDPCLVNGNFENDLENWSSVASSLSIVDGYGGSTNALKAYSRSHQGRGGPWQDISTTCLVTNEWYEISAKVKLTSPDDGSVFNCDSSLESRYHNSLSCAGMSININGNLKTIGYTVGPTSGNSWNDIYGVFQATSDIMSQTTVGIGVARAPVGIDITIDNVHLAPASLDAIGGESNCMNPISNGDAETGDHRTWWIRGHGDNGQIEIKSPGFGETGHSFFHSGTRHDKYYSMMQILDNSCFTQGSQWIITAKYKFYDSAGNPVECDKGNAYASNACPVFSFSAGNIVNTGPLENLVASPAAIGEWNEITNTFTVTSDMVSYADMWVTVVAGASYNYEIDNIVMSNNE